MRKILSLLTAILFAGSMMATDVAVTIHASSGDYYAKTHSWQNGTQYDQVELDENITAIRIGTGNNGKYYQDWRFYTNGSNTGSFSIDAAEGYELQSVTFTYATQNNGALYMGETQLTSQTAVAVSGQQAVFQCKNTNDATNGQVRLTAISVTYGAAAPAPSHTYTVAGDNADLFGTTWAPANTANDMALVEGLYTWEKTEQTLAAGNVAFKVCEDHDWANCWPAENYQLAIPEGGVYTITITYNPANNAVNAVATKTGSAVVIPTVAMHGNFLGSWADTENFEVAEGNATASLTLNLAAGNYEFGMRIGGSGNWTANGVHFTRENNSAAVVAGQGNLTLAADAAGEYTFTWTYETNTLAITFPEAGPVEPTAKFYVTGNAALVGQDKEWNPAAIESMDDSKVLSLEAGSYMMKITLNGTWEGENNVKGYDALTGEIPAGVTRGEGENNDNICFTLAEAGDVTVTYTGEIFTIAGNFYVEPAPAPKYYLKNNWNGGEWSWKEMAAIEAGNYLLDSVVFGGTGVNFNTAASDENAVWVALEAFLGEEIQANDTVALVLHPADSTITATLIGRPAEVVAPKFYITGNAALVGQDKEWNPGAIESMDDSKVLSLEAGSYMMKITLNGTWEGENNVKGYDALTGEIPAGVTRGEGENNDNICFTLAEAGDVTVTYTGEIFTIAGNFYVEPAPAPKYYLKNNWNGGEWSWKEMAAIEAGNYLLDSVVFGGTGVNFNTAASDENAVWVALEAFSGDEIQANDTVALVLHPADSTITATLIGRPAEVVAPKFYITGNAALVGQDKEWNPGAIESMDDSKVLSLEAGSYMMKITLKGNWDEGVLGYDALTGEIPAGVTRGEGNDNDNICFTLAEAGDVTVTYTGEIFTIAGNFYVAPIEPTAKFYVVGNEVFAGADAWNPTAIPSMTDTLVHMAGQGINVLRLSLNGTWDADQQRDFRNLTEVADGLSEDIDEYQNHNIKFVLEEAGEVKIIYNETTFKLEGNFYVDPVVPTAKFYITGNAALVGAENEWNPAAIESMEDSKVLALEAGSYMMKITLKGNWDEGVLGYDALTGEIPAGVTRGEGGDNDNICFTLAEAGNVTVTYTGEIFTIAGNFYVAPPADPTVAVIGDMTEWEAQLPFELSEDKTYATLSNDNIKKGTYAFKLIVNGEWRSNGYEYHREFPGAAGITGNVEANMTVNIDVEGAYTFVWTFANDSFAIVYPEKPEPQLANGYYLVGSMNDWTPAAEYFLEQNPDNEAEYELDINLNVNDEIKVVYVESEAIVTWYPAEGDNYVIDDHHNGVTTLYFRPDYLGGDDWFAGCIYVVPTSTVGFDNVDADAKAIKQVINGKLFILRGDKTYTVDGQIVR